MVLKNSHFAEFNISCRLITSMTNYNEKNYSVEVMHDKSLIIFYEALGYNN